MTRSSGLAPAVNAHLMRWADVDQEWTAMHRAKRTSFAPGRQTLAWAYFARSWGIPDGDGVIQTPVLVDGATINGREQFSSTELAATLGQQLMEKELHMLTRA